MSTATILPIIKHLYRRYRHDALRRGKEFNITLEYFSTLINQPCAYCYSSPANIYTQKQYAIKSLVYNGVDRIDSGGEYTEDNTISCCADCNRAKSNRDDQFKDSYWLQARRMQVLRFGTRAA